MNLLVTGGAGFIGSNFIRYWLKKYPNDKIYNLDLLTYAGHSSSTKDFKEGKNYKFVKGNISNGKLVESLVRKADTVVHFAAETHVDRSILGPSIFFKTNVLGTQTLLEAARKYKLKRFHHISTDEVFGELPLGKGRFNENTAYNPRSPYAASKAASDHLVRSYLYTFNVPFTITNCSNNFGPFQDPEKFIPRMITNLLAGKKVPIYGDGKYVRDWIFVEDHVLAIEKVLKKGKVGETYLVGGQKKDVNNLTIAQTLLELFNLNDSYIEFVKDRPGHDRRYAIDSRKIQRELNWKPKHSFKKALQITVNWYKENSWWWRPLKQKSEKIYK